MLSKKYAEVDRNICVACGACLKECPKSAIQVVRGCYAEVEQEICTGMGGTVQLWILQFDADLHINWPHCDGII